MNISIRKEKSELFWGLNLLGTLILSVVISACVSSDAMLEKVLYVLFDMKNSFIIRHGFRENLFTGICLYSRTALWSYALVFAIAYWMKDSLAGLKKAFLTAAVFETATELILMFLLKAERIDGTAVLVGIGASLFAMVLILLHEGAVS